MALRRLTAAVLAWIVASAAADDSSSEMPRPHRIPKGPLALRAEERRRAANTKVQIPGTMSHWLGLKSGHDFSTKYASGKQGGGSQKKLAAMAAASTVDEQGLKMSNPYERRLNGEAPAEVQKKQQQRPGPAAAAASMKKPKAKTTLLRSTAHTKLTAAQKAHAFDDLELPESFGHTASMTAVSSKVEEGANAYLAGAGLDQPDVLAPAVPQDDNSYVATLMGGEQQRTMKQQEKEVAPKSGNGYLDAILPAKYVGLEK